MKKATIGTVILGTVLLFSVSLIGSATEPGLTDIELLGKYIFFDKISVPQRMSCSTCHEPRAGGTSAIAGINLHDVVMPGADPHTFGTLKPPSNAYATFSPRFAITPRGGNFWNGRSIGFGGDLTGNHTEVIDGSIFLSGYEYPEYLIPTADQALNPFPNHVEQNIPKQEVCRHVAAAKYAELFMAAFGEEIDCSDTKWEVNYKRIAVALAAYQASNEVNSFSSKLDAALKYDKEVSGENPPLFPLTLFTNKENLGHDLFYQHCAGFCHNSGSIGQNRTDEGELYTSHLYFNIGTPANPEIPGFPNNVGLGLHDHTLIPGHEGLQKTPTMRNVDKRPGKGFTKAYTHNGWFKSLESIVHFYNTRDVKPVCPDHITTEKDALENNCWPPPEVADNVFSGGPFGLGDMGLSPEEEAAIVAYVKTLTDTYTPKKPKPY